MPKPRFSPRLRLATLWPALAAVAVAAGLLWILLPGLLRRAAGDQLSDTLALIVPLVESRDSAEGDELQEWVLDFAGRRDLRLTLIAADGHVLADSQRTPEQLGRMENHADRQEIREAFAEGGGRSERLSATTGIAYVYAAQLAEDRGGRPLVVRLAQPLQQLRELQRSLAATLGLAVTIALLMMAATSWWLDRRLFGPLSRLIADAGILAGGDYEHPIELPASTELSDLGQALERLGIRVRQQIGAVQTERDRLTTLLATLPEGVLELDGEGRAVFANSAFRRLFGIEDEVAGLPLLDLARRPRLAELADQTLDLRQVCTTELEISTPRKRTLELSGSPLGGSRTGVLIVARDISAKQRLYEIRRDFVANVSHELKTPLTAIRGYAESLRDGALEDSEAAPRFTGRILEQCRRLELLLTDLLTLSRLESPALPEHRSSVDLRAIADRALDLVGDQARDRQVALEGDLEVVPEIAGDAEGLERMLLNLLENAIKYNRPGGQVALRLRRDADSLTVSVEDTGIGISAEALPRIFERFYRADKGRSRAEGGTGLGLAIVKHVAQSHGGEVEVESAAGEGSRFRVRIPLAAQDPPGRPVAAP